MSENVLWMGMDLKPKCLCDCFLSFLIAFHFSLFPFCPLFSTFSYGFIPWSVLYL